MLAARLTPRDFWIIRMLHKHRVLTANQITTLASRRPGPGRCAYGAHLRLIGITSMQRVRKRGDGGLLNCGSPINPFTNLCGSIQNGTEGSRPAHRRPGRLYD